MSSVDERPLPELSSYVSHVRRTWPVLLVTTLIGAAIGASIFFSLPVRYFASSRVALSPQITYLSLSVENEKQPLVTIDTTASLLRSDRAVAAMADAMKVTPQEARDNLVISAKPGSRVLVVQVRAATKKQAVAGSNAATDQLLKLQAETFALSEARVSKLKNRVSVLKRQALDAIADGTPGQGQLQTANLLQARLDKAIATNNTDSAVIIRAKATEYRPGQGEVFIASGLTLGLLFGILLTQLPWARWRRALSGGGHHRRVSFAGSSQPDDDVVPAARGALGGVPGTPATTSAHDEEDPGDHELT